MSQISEPKILADENVSPKVVSWLRGKGLDVIDTKEENWHGQEDEFLLEKAYLQKRFVLTHDSDFGTLTINEGKSYHGIIYLKLKNMKPTNVVEVIDKFFLLDIQFNEGSLIVIDRSKVRVRKSNITRQYGF
jgi:predicted nuclease of predicted toxin-antitoxin system